MQERSTKAVLAAKVKCLCGLIQVKDTWWYQLQIHYLTYLLWLMWKSKCMKKELTKKCCENSKKDLLWSEATPLTCLQINSLYLIRTAFPLRNLTSSQTVGETCFHRSATGFHFLWQIKNSLWFPAQLNTLYISYLCTSSRCFRCFSHAPFVLFYVVHITSV